MCQPRCMNQPAKLIPTETPSRPWAPRVKSSEVEAAALSEGFTALQSMLIARRFKKLPEGPIRQTIYPTVADIPRASRLPDIAVAASAVADVILNRGTICVLGDHDADGLTALSVVWTALTKTFGMPAELIHVVPSHRLREGFGVSDKLVERVLSLDPRPSLVITVDQGSSNEAQIADLLAAGIKTIVTDHHHLPEEGPPRSALACVNPVREDSAFGDATIAGCMVAFYLMVAVQHELKARGALPTVGQSLNACLPAVAVGTCADCVDMGLSKANRWAVKTGLDMIRKEDKPIWQAFSPLVRGEWSSTSISFNVAPRVNAASRMGDAVKALEALCAEDYATAQAWVQVLDEVNTERKRVQALLVAQAMEMAWPMVAEGAPALCLPFYTGGHAGIHGVVAARVVEMTGLPTVCLSPVEGDPNRMTGSIRSIEGAHVKHLLDGIAAAHPEWSLKHGGHSGAGGVRLDRQYVPLFGTAWELAVGEALEGRPPPPREHDGALPCAPSKQVVDEIEALAPYGRGFPEPVFVAEVEVLRVAPLGKDDKHCSLDVIFPGNVTGRAVWFNSVTVSGVMPVSRGPLTMIYEISRSNFARGPGFDIKVKDILL